MKNLFRNSGVILLIILIHSCMREQPAPPIITTAAVTGISYSTATSGGKVTNEGTNPINFKGVCWNTSPYPTVLNNKTLEVESGDLGTFISKITQLKPNTTYYIRAYATTDAGTGYGTELNFKTLESISDIDGNNYNIRAIGSQIWMIENLRTTKYNDGSSIPNVIENAAWIGLKSAAYCWYNNDEATYKNTFGALYNWYTVKTGKLCPAGWHVPSDTEWHQLALYLDPKAVIPITGITESIIAGDKLKEAGITHWASPNTGATNETGFTALPAGYRYSLTGDTWGRGALTYWWSSTNIADHSWSRRLDNSISDISREYTSNRAGISVRCIKD
jgi:uncharacterized protein (TIGR02145 family)